MTRILFCCRRIQKSLLQTRREAELILYYYNVWKTRATPRARSWFTALEQVRWSDDCIGSSSALVKTAWMCRDR